VTWIKESDGKVTVGIASMAQRVCAVYFQNLTGTKLQYVPYRGAGPALQDVVAGISTCVRPTIQLSATATSGKHQGVRQLRQKKRLASLPTRHLSTSRRDRFDISVWNAIWGTEGYAEDVIARLNVASSMHSRTQTSELDWRNSGKSFPCVISRRPERSQHSKSRNRKVVADHQGGEHQAGVICLLAITMIWTGAAVVPVHLFWMTTRTHPARATGQSV